jgi:hypothetical protein
MTRDPEVRAAAARPAQAQDGHRVAGGLLWLPHVVPGHRRAAAAAAGSGRVRPLAADRHQDPRPLRHRPHRRGLCNAENVHVLREFRAQLQDPGGRGRLRHQRRPAGAAQPARCRQILRDVYCTQTGISANSQIPNDPELPLPLNQVHPIHEVVHVDYFLPGCPPSGTRSGLPHRPDRRPHAAIWDTD